MKSYGALIDREAKKSAASDSIHVSANLLKAPIAPVMMMVLVMTTTMMMWDYSWIA